MFKLYVACTRLPVFSIYLFGMICSGRWWRLRIGLEKGGRAIHRSEGTRREDLKMRFLIAAMAFVLLTLTAHAQGTGKGHKGELQKEDQAKKKEDQEKKKALEDAYKNTLKSIPDSNEKPDPWKTMR